MNNPAVSKRMAGKGNAIMRQRNKLSKHLRKFPCNTTRFFFDKVNGKQFHPKFSGCDDFTVRLQVRKNKAVKWEDVAYKLAVTDWLLIFQQPGMCSTNDTELVATFRNKMLGDHKPCLMASKAFQKAFTRAQRLGFKEVNHDWPIVCKLRKK